MKKNLFSTKNLSLYLIVSIVLWVVTMIWSMADVKPGWDQIDYVQKVMKFETSFIITYINATLLTLLAVALFWKLFLHFSTQNRGLSEAALFFLLIYGTINLVAYGSQLVVLPVLSHKIYNTDLSSNDIAMVYHWIQMAPGTKIAAANGLAYAALGIPSIIFGLMMMKINRFGKIAGWLFIANAIACMLGFWGMLANNKVLQFGTVAGGVIFLAAVVFLFMMFKTNPSGMAQTPADQ